MNVVTFGCGTMIEPRYLVYRMYNGKVHSEIQHGLHQTGEGIKNDVSELRRIPVTQVFNVKEVPRTSVIYQIPI